MKKTLLNFVYILIGVFVLFSLLDIKGEYGVEKIIVQTNARLSKVAQSPEAIPDKTYDSIAASYKKIIDRFPNSKYTPSTYLLLAQTYLTQKSYDTARKILSEACTKYPKNDELCAQALVLTANSYEMNNQWPQALANYEKIISKFPLTDTGITVPLYIARYYQKKEKPADTQAAYARAISHYKNLISSYPNSIGEFKVMGLLSNAYIDTKQWNNALDTLAQSLKKYSNTQAVGSIVQNINVIGLGKLQDKDRVIAIYQDIINDKPKAPIAELLKKMIKEIETLKKAKADILLDDK